MCPCHARMCIDTYMYADTGCNAQVMNLSNSLTLATNTINKIRTYSGAQKLAHPLQEVT